MNCSIIIPAHNEEKVIKRCLDSITRAVEHGRHQVEIIVVANRCNDRTTDIAHSFNATVIPNQDRNLAKIRNTGAAVATGDVLVTIDADSWMSDNMLTEIDRHLSSGHYIGGGTAIRPERYSTGILISTCLLHVVLFFRQLCGGLYWCRREDFFAIGGFDESLRIAEDLDFAQRLKEYGFRHGKRLKKIRRAHIYTSCRKFDHFGDWFALRMLLLHPIKSRHMLSGKNAEMADLLFYDFKH